MIRLFGRRFAAALLLGAIWTQYGAAAQGGQAAAPAPPPLDQLFGGSFELTDQDGNRRTDRDFHGRFALIYFGYTSCPDICPTSLSVMTNALDKLGEAAERVQPIFITVDPERDTPAVLKDYVAAFDDRLIGLTGSEADVAKAARAFRVHRRKVLPNWSSNEKDYLVDHSSLTVLLGPDGHFLTLFPHRTDASTMAARLAKYLKAETAGEPSS